MVIFLILQSLLFVNLYRFANIFHIPEAGLLVVVSAEVDKVANQIIDEIMLNLKKMVHWSVGSNSAV